MGIEPTTSSLPRMRTTDRAATARMVVPEGIEPSSTGCRPVSLTVNDMGPLAEEARVELAAPFRELRFSKALV